MTTPAQTGSVAPKTTRPRWFFHFTAKEGFVAGIVIAAVQFREAFRWGIAEQTDLAIFQRTAMLWRVRSSDEDTAWLLLLLAAILASPVGWVYYQPLLVGPGVALALSGRFPQFRWIAVTCVVPGLRTTLFQGSPLVALTLGSVYFWGLLAAFVGLLRPNWGFANARERQQTTALVFKRP